MKEATEKVSKRGKTKIDVKATLDELRAQRNVGKDQPPAPTQAPPVTTQAAPTQPGIKI
ncbi:hypothetical protein [Treponema sp. R6D11]